MAHRPYPNRKCARRQVDRHHQVVDSWASARPRTGVGDPRYAADTFRLGDYRVSTR
jgi:hypothetical protein